MKKLTQCDLVATSCSHHKGSAPTLKLWRKRKGIKLHEEKAHQERILMLPINPSII